MGIVEDIDVGIILDWLVRSGLKNAHVAPALFPPIGLPGHPTTRMALFDESLADFPHCTNDVDP